MSLCEKLALHGPEVRMAPSEARLTPSEVLPQRDMLARVKEKILIAEYKKKHMKISSAAVACTRKSLFLLLGVGYDSRV